MADRILQIFSPSFLYTTNIEIFSSSEIPQYRLPYEVVDFELQLAKDIGVNVCFSFIDQDQYSKNF